MKSYKELFNQNLSEGGEMYPADEMTMKELKIACYAANNILERLEDGAMIQRWQISAIVKASEELASVYTSMSADMEMEDDYEDYYEDEVVGYEYPWMGEEVELDEEQDYKVSVEGLPDMYVKGNSPSEVKATLRKVVKKPDMVRSVDRVTQSMLKKIFRDKAAGKEDLDEAILNELSPGLLAKYKKKAEKSAFSNFDKAGVALAKAQDAEEMASHSDTESGYDYHQGRAEKHMDNFQKFDRIHNKRAIGSALAGKKLSAGQQAAKEDLKNLSANEFQKKYRMTKAEWERKNK